MTDIQRPSARRSPPADEAGPVRSQLRDEQRIERGLPRLPSFPCLPHRHQHRNESDGGRAERYPVTSRHAWVSPHILGRYWSSRGSSGRSCRVSRKIVQIRARRAINVFGSTRVVLSVSRLGHRFLSLRTGRAQFQPPNAVAGGVVAASRLGSNVAPH